MITGHEAASPSLRTAIMVAFLKVYFIGTEFMELRTAAPALRALFSALAVVVAARPPPSMCYNRGNQP
jgi:hypothetical protein